MLNPNKERFLTTEFVAKRLNILKHIKKCHDAAGAAFQDVCYKRKIMKELLENVRIQNN